jgi:heat shock protein HtpX
MWELIRANQRKSIVLFMLMGSILIALGYFVGETYFPGQGGAPGAMLAVAIWVVWSAVAYWGGDSILLGLSRAREVTHDVHPQLFNVVEEMKIAANLPVMPKIYIIDDESPNAFATGTRPDKCAVAITSGLLNRLNRYELQGVIAHEMSHLMNRDVLFVTFAGIMLGTVVMISDFFLRSLWFGGGRSRSRRSGKSGGGGGGALVIVAIALAILAPLLTQLFYFALSRKREYLADASAVRLTRYPEGLASALEKISVPGPALLNVNRVTAPMYIVNPLKKAKASSSNWFSTHPPSGQRVKILRNMMHGAGYINYQTAFKIVTGKDVIPGSALKDKAPVGLFKPAEQTAAATTATKAQKRDVGDLVRAVNGYIFLTCLCGLKLKLPPTFKNPHLNCPRCKREIEVPLAKLAAIATAVSKGTEISQKKEEFVKETTAPSPPSSADQGPLVYTRKGSGWESVACSCGNHLTLSPHFVGQQMSCRKCGRQVIVK